MPFEKDFAQKERLLQIAKEYENCIYLEVTNVGEGDLLAYHIGEDTGLISPFVHVGMTQDSVLYMQYEGENDSCGLDFRYFPKGFSCTIMETYSWSDNIRQVVIKNDTGKVLTFNHVDLADGETIVFTPDSHRQGLISPDSYNGKSAFLTEQDIQKRQTDSLHVSKELKSQYEKVTKRKADTEEYQKLLCLYYDEGWADICMHYTIVENRKALERAVGFIVKKLQDCSKEPFGDDTEIEWVPIPEEGPKDWENRLSDFVRCEILNNSES